MFIPRFSRISQRVSGLLSRHDFQTYKGAKFRKIIWVELWHLISAHGPIMLYICITFRESILKGFRVIERTHIMTNGHTDTDKFTTII